MRTIACIFLFTLITKTSYGQNIRDFNGYWKLKNVVSLYTSDYKDKKEVANNCKDLSLSIKENKFTVRSSNNCYLHEVLKSKNDFKIFNPVAVSRNDTTYNYPDLLFYHFNKEDSNSKIELFNTNNKIDNSEIESIILLKRANMIYIYTGEAIVEFVNK